MRFLSPFVPLLKLIGHGALSGAISALTTNAVTPDFDGKPEALGAVAVIGAAKGMVNLLQQPPVDVPRRRRRGLPVPQERPARRRGDK